MDVVELTQQLIAIPSYVDGESGVNEAKLGAYVEQFLRHLGYLNVERQVVASERFNVIAHDGHPPRLMFCCHLDTVPASGHWSCDPYGGEVIGDRLYGLGAADMKGGIACLLHALTAFAKTKGLWLLFDVDEEYYFQGMLKFLEEYRIQPELAVFTEPGMDIQNGHRGLIEVGFRVRGSTGHASRPDTGRNAILGATRAVEHLLERLKSFDDPTLGESSCNLAFLRGGIYVGEDDAGNTLIAERANKIPDVAEVVLDLRPAVSTLRAQTVLELLNNYLVSEGFSMDKVETRLDFGALLVAKDQLTIIESVVREIMGTAKYANISEFGYGEGQLLNERLGVPCVYFGPGPGETAHQVDEYVSISEMQQTRDVYRRLIEHYCAC